MHKRNAVGLCLAASLWAASALAQDNCPLPTQRGHIVLQKSGDRWLIPMAINGTFKYMFLHTGTGFTTITQETVDELKLPVRPSREALITASTGERSYAYIAVDALALGGAGRFTNSEYPMEPNLPNGQKRPADFPAGYVGLELLSHFDFDLDLKAGVLNLFNYEHCPGKVVYWKTDAPAVAVPFEWDGLGRVRFKLKLDGLQLYAVLNTLDTDDTLNLTYYKSQTKFDETAPGVQLADTNADGGKLYRAGFASLDIGGITIANPSILLREDKLKGQTRASSAIGSSIRNTELLREPDITLGVATLAKLHVYVAAKERKLYITPVP